MIPHYRLQFVLLLAAAPFCTARALSPDVVVNPAPTELQILKTIVSQMEVGTVAAGHLPVSMTFHNGGDQFLNGVKLHIGFCHCVDPAFDWSSFVNDEPNTRCGYDWVAPEEYTFSPNADSTVRVEVPLPARMAGGNTHVIASFLDSEGMNYATMSRELPESVQQLAVSPQIAVQKVSFRRDKWPGTDFAPLMGLTYPRSEKPAARLNAKNLTTTPVEFLLKFDIYRRVRVGKLLEQGVFGPYTLQGNETKDIDVFLPHPAENQSSFVVFTPVDGAQAALGDLREGRFVTNGIGASMWDVKTDKDRGKRGDQVKVEFLLAGSPDSSGIGGSDFVTPIQKPMVAITLTDRANGTVVAARTEDVEIHRQGSIVRIPLTLSADTDGFNVSVRTRDNEELITERIVAVAPQAEISPPVKVASELPPPPAREAAISHALKFVLLGLAVILLLGLLVARKRPRVL